jgi:hypothetical protein
MIQRPISLEQLRTIRDGSGHSIYGPSGSGMWLNCPGSLLPNLLAKDDGNEDSAYGTVAHGVTELWGKTCKRPMHLVGKNEFVEAGEWGFLVWIDEEMLDYAQMCIEWVDWIEGDKLWERRVDFSRITPIPNQTGTADLIIVQLEQRRILVVDWKFGKGVKVFAEHNTQGMLYALGALWEMEAKYGVRFDIIEIRIGQPRLDHFDEWELTRDDLIEFAGWAKARMALAWQLDAPRVAGVKQCEFCKVKASCAANAKLNIELTEGVFENLENPHPVSAEQMQEFKDRIDHELHMEAIEAATLTTEQLAKLLPFRRLADKWWKTIDIELMKRSVAGEDLTPLQWKIVEARSRRKFKDKTEAVQNLEDLGVPPWQSIKEELVSPAEAERLLIKAGHRKKDLPSLLEGLTYKPPGKPTLARLTDKRPVMADITEGVFDNLETETTEDEED